MDHQSVSSTPPAYKPLGTTKDENRARDGGLSSSSEEEDGVEDLTGGHLSHLSGVKDTTIQGASNQGMLESRVKIPQGLWG